MDLLLQMTFNGVLIGGILALLTIGFQLTFGVLHVIDFAVGGWVMLGGYAGYYMGTLVGLGPFLAIPPVFVAFALIGYSLGPLIYRVRSSRYARPDLMALAFTFGIFILMRGGALTVWGFNTRNVESAFSADSVEIFGATLPALRVAAFGLALVLTLALFVMLHRTRFGLAVQAVAQNRQNAALMGIDVKKVSAAVYGIYTGLTSAAGVLIAAIYSVNPEVGVKYTLFAFFVAVLAGMGSVNGVLVAALFLGVIEAFVAGYVGAIYSHFVVFGALYIVLLVSPSGILRQGS